MALRGLSLAGCALLGALLLPRLRVPGGAWLGYSAFAIGFVYPMAKLYWSAGGTLLRPEGYAEGFPSGELIMLLIGAVGSLGAGPAVGAVAAAAAGAGRRLDGRCYVDHHGGHVRFRYVVADARPHPRTCAPVRPRGGGDGRVRVRELAAVRAGGRRGHAVLPAETLR